MGEASELFMHYITPEKLNLTTEKNEIMKRYGNEWPVAPVVIPVLN